VATWNVGTWPHCRVPYFHVAMWPYALIHVATWSCVLNPRCHVATCTNPTCPGSHMVIWACRWYNQQRGHLDHVAIWPRGYSNGYCSHTVICMNFCSYDFGFSGKGDRFEKLRYQKASIMGNKGWSVLAKILLPRLVHQNSCTLRPNNSLLTRKTLNGRGRSRTWIIMKDL